ncbi:MAG TPA: DUF1707 domain-containing protein [Solirubrobacteraceae bacterium]|nr:DUF1707 domain-containing protein [Solirubrobacteraceae bacterium]
MTRRSSILASDSDRERVAERLRQAATEGRILAHELEERVARALRARTYGELDALVADLPGASAPVRGRSATTLRLARAHPVAAVVVLVTLTLMVCIAAAVMAFSGVWMLFVVLALGRFGPWSRGTRYRARYGRYGPGSQGGSRNGRAPYWVR